LYQVTESFNHPWLDARLNAIRWIETNVPPGGPDQLLDRVSGTDDLFGAILYFLTFDPGAPAATDPRPGLRLGFRRRPILCVAFTRFQKRVLLDLRLDERAQLQVGELQHLYRLLQLRRHHQSLALAQFKPLRKADSVHKSSVRSRAYRLNRSPR